MKHIFSQLLPKVVFCETENALGVQQALDAICLKSEIVTFGECNEFYSFDKFLETHGDIGSIESFRASDFDPADTTALLISTSGTTGPRKSAALTHKNFLVNGVYTWITYHKFPAPIEKVLILSPVQWYSALYKIIFSPIVRVTRIQSSLPSTTEHTYFLINKYKPNLLMTTPNMLAVLLKSSKTKCDFSCFDTIISAGSVPHEFLARYIKEASPNTNFYVAYGMMETSGLLFNFACQVPGTCGKPLGTSKYRLVNVETLKDITGPNVAGELWVKGPGIFKGYHNNDEETRNVFTEDGWMRTGDLLKRDEHWNFYFVERLKMMLKYNTHQISPTEVEEVIMEHPGVFEVAVTSVPDKQAGDLVVACVIPNEGYSLKAQEIKDIVKNVLSDTKQLRGGVVFMNQLPLTATFKVDRKKTSGISAPNAERINFSVRLQ